MSRFLPLFPLSLVVFPGETLRLYIFEQRYRQLIRECVTENKSFGIPSVFDRKQAEFATELRVDQIDKTYPGGEMDITCVGLHKIRILEFQKVAPEKLYPGGMTEVVEDVWDGKPEMREQIFELLKKLNMALGIANPVVKSADEITSYSIGHHVGFSVDQEYELLTLPKESRRLRKIHNHLENVLPVVVETQRMKMRARMNGHHKNLLPPDF